MKTLIIVESPAKCKKIEQYLGKNYKCVASFGHIREIPNGLKSLDDNLKPQYKISRSKAQTVANIRKYIKSCKEVILASDDDREGEAIAWHICQVFKLPVSKTKRIIFHEITKTALQAAISNVKRIDMNKVYSQQARSVIDVLMGYKLSPLLWRNIVYSTKAKLSAGRCQSPALRLVCEQEALIKENKGEKKYITEGTFANTKFLLNEKMTEKEKVEEFLEESVNFDHYYKKDEFKEKLSKKMAPAPFTTSSLQQKSSNFLGYSPKQTMSLAQKLYENGYITYMRTDNKKYSKEFIKTTKDHIKFSWGDEYISKNLAKITLFDKKPTSKTTSKSTTKSTTKSTKNKKDLAQEAHEAIRPTNIKTLEVSSDKLHPSAKRLYKLIWLNTIQSCMSDAIFDTITMKIHAPFKFWYSFTAEKVKFKGFLISDERHLFDATEYNSVYAIFDKLQNTSKQTVDYSEIYCKLQMTNLKNHYTEAKLVSLLESKGIGRPSTFSSIISKIQDRNYTAKQNVEGREIECTEYKLTDDTIEEINVMKTFGNEKNKLVATQLGGLVNDFLVKNFEELINYDFTKQMEEQLDLIEKGELTFDSVVGDFNKKIEEMTKSNKINKLKIKIDDHHTYVIGRHGPVLKCVIEGKTTFKQVKKNIDMERLQAGELTLKEIIDDSPAAKAKSDKKVIGIYEDNDITVRNGKFGYYLNHNKKNYSLKSLKPNEVEELSFDRAVEIIKQGGLKLKGKANPNILKEINENCSVRKGKWGPYVYYKTEKMNKPKFIKMGKLKIDDITLDWVQDQLVK